MKTGVMELTNLAFIAEATNILLLGPSGVGKTHLAVALALKAIENGQGAYFVRAYDLMEYLRKARIENNLDRRMKVYLAPKVLIGDELGIWPYDRGRPLHSSPWYRPGTKGAPLSSPPTRASASGVSCWGTVSSPRPSWTDCSTTAMC